MVLNIWKGMNPVMVHQMIFQLRSAEYMHVQEHYVLETQRKCNIVQETKSGVMHTKI